MIVLLLASTLAPAAAEVEEGDNGDPPSPAETPQTVVLDAVADTYVESSGTLPRDQWCDGSPESDGCQDVETLQTVADDFDQRGPAGASQKLRVGFRTEPQGDEVRFRAYTPLLDFGLTEALPPGSFVTNAVLELDTVGGIAHDVTARAVAESWDEVSAGYSPLPGLDGREFGTMEFDLGKELIDVTGLVNRVLARGDHGFALLPSTLHEEVAEIRSRESNAVDGHPKLHVAYLQDAEDPTAGVTAPVYGATLFGMASVAATADDDGVVDRVEFYVEDTLFAVDDEAPYSFALDTTQLEDGEYLITARAVDVAGRTGDSSVGVYVNNEATQAERLDADFADGTLELDEYIRYVMYSAYEDARLPNRYGDGPLDDAAGVWAALRMTEYESAVSPAAAAEFGDYLRLQTVPVASRTTASASSTTPDRDCFGSVYFVSIFTEFRCMTSRGDHDIYYNLAGFDPIHGVEEEDALDENLAPIQDGNGIPDIIDGIGLSLVSAQSDFGSLGFRDPGGLNVFVEQRGRGLSSPIVFNESDRPSIRIPKDFSTPQQLVRHEFFHHVQFEYGVLGQVLFKLNVGEFAWLVESTAEWATHQSVAMTPPGEPNASAERFAYARSIHAFLEDPASGLDSGRWTSRSYGSFVVWERFQQRLDQDVVRNVLEGVEGGKHWHEALNEILFATHGATLSDELVDMWRDVYFLDISIPDRVDATERNEWRDRLGAPAASDPVTSLARMDAELVQVADGEIRRGRVQLGSRGAHVLEIIPTFADGERFGTDMKISAEVTHGASERVDIAVVPLEGYAGYPGPGPDLCGSEQTLKGPTAAKSIDIFISTQCEYVAVVLTNADEAAASVAWSLDFGVEPATILDNGVLQLGVNPHANLIAPTGPLASGGGSPEYVGLRFKPNDAEGLAYGFLAEGWGVGNSAAGSMNGWANLYYSQTAERLQLQSFRTTHYGATSVVRMLDTSGRAVMQVTHDFFPIPQTPYLYQVDVTIENVTSVADGNRGGVSPRYRRVMDWDIPPTPANEWATIAPTDPNRMPGEVAYFSNNGFAHPNPFAGDSQQTDPHVSQDPFHDVGPTDQGALIDLDLAALQRAGAKTQFTMWYGAAPDEDTALDAVFAVDSDLLSFGQPNTQDGPTTGVPNTFIWAFQRSTGEQPPDAIGLPNQPAGVVDVDPGVDRDVELSEFTDAIGRYAPGNLVAEQVLEELPRTLGRSIFEATATLRGLLLTDESPLRVPVEPVPLQ